MYTGGPFAGGGPIFFRQKVVVDLLLDERMVPGKFGCTNSYGVEMHKEPAYKHSSLYIYRFKIMFYTNY